MSRVTGRAGFAGLHTGISQSCFRHCGKAPQTEPACLLRGRYGWPGTQAAHARTAPHPPTPCQKGAWELWAPSYLKPQGRGAHLGGSVG